MAKVLLVDAAFSAEPLYRALCEQQHQVVTLGNRRRDALVGLGKRHRLIDYSDIDALEDVIQEERPDFLVPGCTDASYASCVAVNRDGRYPGIDAPETFSILHNKQSFRHFCAREGLSAPKLLSLEEAKRQQAIMIKPVDAYSGRGITCLRQPDEHSLAQASAIARAASPTGQVILEPYVEGQLYSHSAFIVRGRMVREHWVTEHCAANPFVVDISHRAQGLPETLLREIRAQMEHLARTLELCDGLLHTQFIRHGDHFSLIEITRRCPGDLYSQLIQLGGAWGYARAYNAGFLGLTPEPPAESAPVHILRHTLSCPAEEAFYWTSFAPPVPLRAVVPLMHPGERAERQSRRAAVAFYQCSDAESLKALCTQLRANPWVGATHLGGSPPDTNMLERSPMT